MSTIKLTVKQIGSTAFPSAIPMLFNTDKIAFPQASGQDTQFEYEGRNVIVDETFATVEAYMAILSLTSGNVREIWGLFDATEGKAVGAHNLVDPITLLAITIPPNAR